MNLKPISVWAFLLSLFSYFLCLVNAIIAVVTILPMMTRNAGWMSGNQAVMRNAMMQQMGSGSLLFLTLIGWTAMLVAAVALILSIVALVKAKGEKYPGKGFAVTGLILSAVYLGLSLVGVIINLISGNGMMFGTINV
jgi:hypothetical protein